MALNLTQDERVLIKDALDAQIASMDRQANTKGRTKTMQEVFWAHKKVLQDLQTKVIDSK